MLAGLRRRAAHNGLELSCPAAQATLHPFSRISAGKSRANFPHASRVSCSELLCGAPIPFRFSEISGMGHHVESESLPDVNSIHPRLIVFPDHASDDEAEPSMVELRASVKELEHLAVAFLTDYVKVDLVLGTEQTIVQNKGHPADEFLGVLAQGVFPHENRMIPIV